MATELRIFCQNMEVFKFILEIDQQFLEKIDHNHQQPQNLANLRNCLLPMLMNAQVGVE